LVYHCLDRVVILGHLPLLTRPENVVHFFGDVHGVGASTKEVLRQRTTEYNQWVEAFAGNHGIPIEWAEKGVRKEDYLRPWLRRMERQGRFGVYFMLKSMAVGTSFRSTMPKYPTADPDYRILSRQRSRYAHYYCYVRDPGLGPSALWVGSFLPFSITDYLNGHHFIEQQLRHPGVQFGQDDNAFLWVADPQARQAAANALSAKIPRTRLEYWTLVVGPKFSNKDRQAINLGRHYSLPQVEYCRNLSLRRNFPIHQLCERSCDLGLLRLSAERIAQVFGWRLPKRLPGQLSSVLEQAEHGHHVLRAYANPVMRMYQKFSTFLRLEALSNNLKDFGLNKSLDNLAQLRRTLAAVTDRCAAFEARALDVHVHFSLFQRLALPSPTGSHKIPGLKIHDTRMVRLMEVLLHAGTKVLGWRTAEIHQAMVASFSLAPATYTLTQLRYDLRKMKAHGLLQRDGRRYAYHLTDKGTRVALLFILFHQRVCAPLANSLFHRRPTPAPSPLSKLEPAYHKADQSIDHVIQLLAA
jgi:hypothetical protein